MRAYFVILITIAICNKAQPRQAARAGKSMIWSFFSMRGAPPGSTSRVGLKVAASVQAFDPIQT